MCVCVVKEREREKERKEEIRGREDEKKHIKIEVCAEKDRDVVER